MYKNTLNKILSYSYRRLLQKNRVSFIEYHNCCCQYSGVLGSNINNKTLSTIRSTKKLISTENICNRSLSTSYSSFECWNCGKNNSKDPNAIFCEHCNFIQKPNVDNNYFQILGVPETYDVDEIILAKKYKDLQRLLHPDKFSNRSEAEQRISEEFSSLVNKSYSTLLQPMSRGIYMLKLKGLEIPEQTQVESEFLNEIMERNEAVENADTPEEVIRINDENKDILRIITGQISEGFKVDDTEAVMKMLIRMKYFVSIDTQIKGLIRKMGIVN